MSNKFSLKSLVHIAIVLGLFLGGMFGARTSSAQGGPYPGGAGVCPSPPLYCASLGCTSNGYNGQPMGSPACLYYRMSDGQPCGSRSCIK